MRRLARSALALGSAAAIAAGTAAAQLPHLALPHVGLPTGAVSVIAAAADHRVDAGLGFERSTGPLFGVQLDLESQAAMSLTLRALGGTIDPRTPAAEPRGVGQVSATGRLAVTSWLRATATARVRSYDGPLARQRWSELAVGGEGRTPLFGGRVDGTVGASLAPICRVSGLPSPNLAIAATAALRHSGERLDLALSYSLARYDFPEVRGVRRAEEESLLLVRAGLRIGRRNRDRAAPSPDTP